MISQTRDTQRFAEEVRRIKASVPAILAQWGLRSKFARWRLTQDPGTGLVVLFGVLNDAFLSAHPSPLFNNYFDPRVLFDLTLGLKVPVVSSGREGFRYAFILDRGHAGRLPVAEGNPGPEPSQRWLNSADAKPTVARGWSKPMVIVTITRLHLSSERSEDDQPQADGQWTIVDTQNTVARLALQPAIIAPSRSLVSIVAPPTISAQVEAEVERRKGLSEPRPDYAAQDLNAPNAESWVKGRAELRRGPCLMLHVSDNGAQPIGKSKGASEKAPRLANTQRQLGTVSLVAKA